MNAHRPHPSDAAHSFRRFFDELRELFLERESLFIQVELALLSREHVLIVGPPGTAKSAVASSVLSRIVDETTNRPSLFSKQLSESTVQTDLIGPVDFKVLTETGRTEYITEDGMLGAIHAFLDEVFDGRDMLLRSILNVLHERELKHGQKVTAGRIECAIMTSNRYLSEVLTRSPEVLLAFADRLSFISFVPKSFARPSSRGVMLTRATGGQRPVLKQSLTIQQLDALQSLVEQVHVPSTISEALEQLADALERALLAQVAKLPDYVPTKYFSQRSTVKALWALKAAVIRDRIYRRPDRPLEAQLEDLDALRYFFLLGGPPAAETEALLKAAVDPRERAQLEILRVEHQAFEEVLAKVKTEVGSGVDREAQSLLVKEDLAVAEQLGKNYQAQVAVNAATALMQKLVPGPRHPENRSPLVSAARLLANAVQLRLSRGMAAQGEGRSGVMLSQSVGLTLELCRAVPELRDRLPGLAAQAAQFCKQALEQVALSAESSEFDATVALDGLSALADNLEEEIARVGALATQLSAYASNASDGLIELEQDVRQRTAAALRRRVRSAYLGRKPKPGELLETLSTDSRRLAQLERGIARLFSKETGVRQELLGPLGAAYAAEAFTQVQFDRIDALARAVQSVMETLRREGISAERAVAETRAVIEKRVEGYANVAAKATDAPQPPGQAVQSGEAYQQYRNVLGAKAKDGDFAALLQLDAALSGVAPGQASAFLSQAVKSSVATGELLAIKLRVQYLRSWLTQLLQSLPDPDKVQRRAQADEVLDRLVKSRFPMVALREGELLRLQAALAPLREYGGEISESAKSLASTIHGITSDFTSFSKRLLEIRSRV